MTAIAKDAVVKIHYTLQNTEEQVVDTTDGKDPLEYVHGNGYLIPGLEKELEGKTSGDKLAVTIAPDEAYGQREEHLLVEVSKAGFKGDSEPAPGMAVQVTTEQGERLAYIQDVQDETVTLDMNHPLAGETLHFDVEVVDVEPGQEQGKIITDI